MSDQDAPLRIRRAVRVVAAAIVVVLSSCAYTPNTSVSVDGNAGFRLRADTPVAIMMAPNSENGVPGCVEKTFRRHLPNGPGLVLPTLRETVRAWTTESPPLIDRGRLQDAADAAGADLSALAPDVPYMPVIRGRSEHMDGSGNLDGADVLVLVNMVHLTRFDIDLFDLATGERIRAVGVSSRAKRTYGIFGVFPILIYSNTVGSACDALDEALADIT